MIDVKVLQGGKMHKQGRMGQSVQLKQLLKSSVNLVFSGRTADLTVESCTNHPKEVEPGDAYFAVAPVRPHFAESDDDSTAQNWSDDELGQAVWQAIENGCKVVVADRVIDDLPVPLLVTQYPEEAYGVCIHALWGNPAKALTMIGVSGTYGKTTTSYLIAGMLAESGSPVGLIGTLGIFDGEKVYPSSQSTPPPDELAYWLMRMVANGCSHAVVEISSQAIAESHLAGIQFDAMCLTNIRRNHLDYHGTVESYRRTKLLAFRSLRKKGIAICNADDRVTAAILPLIDHPVLTVGVRNPCEVSGMSIDRNPGDQTFLITAGNETVPLSTKMIGDENLYNCLTATALGIGLGIDLRVAVRGIERVKSVPGRLERIDCGQPFGVFVDSAPTPESLAGSLRSLRKVVQGRLFCVLGIDEHSPNTIMNSDSLGPLCKTLKNWTDVSVITADELRSPEGTLDPESAEKIVRELPGHHVQVIPTRPEAIHWALSNAEPDDCVLVVGRGCTDFQRFLEAEDVNLCDRPLVKSWLYENQPCTTNLEKISSC